MISLSVVVITLNEEKNIARCLDSVQEVADEIIVVDSFSTDKTAGICAQYPNLTFITHTFEGHIQQKNWAMEQASSDYILSLDADECLNKELSAAIVSVKQNWSGPAYRLNRLTNFCGKWVRHSGWHPDWKVRLFDRRLGRWGGMNPHDAFVLHNDYQTELLDGLLLHYSFYNQHEHVKQIDSFSSIKAQRLYENKVPAKKWKFTIYPTLKFLRHYFLQFGFLDGITGFIIAKHSAYYAFLTYCKLWDLYHSENRPIR